MARLTLIEKNELLYASLPKKYAHIILNNIITNSLSNGELLKMSELYVSGEELKEIEKFVRDNTTASKKIKKTTPTKTTGNLAAKEDTSEEGEEEVAFFTGFSN